MSLKALNIIFKELDDLFSEMNEAIESNSELVEKKDTLTFDSPKTWRSFMSNQKLEILTAIARLHPESVYGLAKQLGRASQHVLKDCRELETFGFINLAETQSARNSLRPELKFDYDFVRVDMPVHTSLPISEESIRILDAATA